VHFSACWIPSWPWTLTIWPQNSPCFSMSKNAPTLKGWRKHVQYCSRHCVNNTWNTRTDAWTDERTHEQPETITPMAALPWWRHNYRTNPMPLQLYAACFTYVAQTSLGLSTKCPNAVTQMFGPRCPNVHLKKFCHPNVAHTSCCSNTADRITTGKRMSIYMASYMHS